MVTLQHGPVHGETLVLQRAPIFLRVVTVGKKVDALDLLDDEPASSEEIHVYVRKGKPGLAFVDGSRNGKSWGTRMVIAEYQYYSDQPLDAQMRTKEEWQAWTSNEVQQLIDEKISKNQTDQPNQ